MMSGLGLALCTLHTSSTSSSLRTTSSSSASYPTSSAFVGGTARNICHSLFLPPKVMLKQLTEHIQLCIGSNWLVSSIGANLALVDSFVLEGGVDDL